MYPGHGPPPPMNPESVTITTTTTHHSTGGYPGGLPGAHAPPVAHVEVHGAQVGSYPHPGASYPTPGASYPPPGASYPPPGASYPPPGAYAPPSGGYPSHGTTHTTTTHSSGGLAAFGKALLGGVKIVASGVKSAVLSDPFYNGNRICLRSLASGQQLRIKADGTVDGKGGFGAYAQFDVVRTPGTERVKLRSVANPGKWLRIGSAAGLNGNGTGGQWTEFRLVRHGNQVFSLRSHKHGRYHVGIHPNGNAKAPTATGTGQHARFHVQSLAAWTHGPTHSRGHVTVHHAPPVHHHAGPRVHITHKPVHVTHKPVRGHKPARGGHHDHFRHGATINLRSNATGKNLRIHKDGRVDGLGGSGQLAKFTVLRSGKQLRLRSIANPSNYLRINNSRQLDGKGSGGALTYFTAVPHGGNVYSLQSVKSLGSHVGVTPSGVAKNAGRGQHGRFQVIRLS